MKTLYIMIIFFSLVLGLKATNESSLEIKKEKKDINLIFSKIYKHKFNSL